MLITGLASSYKQSQQHYYAAANSAACLSHICVTKYYDIHCMKTGSIVVCVLQKETKKKQKTNEVTAHSQLNSE